MRHLFAPTLLLAACALSPTPEPIPTRLVWSSTPAMVEAIRALTPGTSTAAPLAIQLAIPEQLPTSEFELIHEALRTRGYVAPHAVPTILDATTDFTVRLALADPVDQPDVTVTQEVARRLWLHDIPFGVEGGNSRSLVVPRRAIPLAQRVLEGIVPPETRWRP